MSRVGSSPIELPTGVEFQVSEGIASAKGTLGSLTAGVPPHVKIALKDGVVTVAPTADSKEARAMWGTARSLMANLIAGVSKGFERKLEINGVGYRAAVQGKDLVLQLGFSHEIKYPIPDGINIKCEKPTAITVSGIDKQKVGQVAAEIRAYRKPEPYKGKGVKYEGEYIFRKEGKKK